MSVGQPANPRRRDRRLDHRGIAVGRRPGDRLAGRGAGADPRLRFAVRAVYGKRTDEIAAWLDEAAGRCGRARRPGRDQRHRPGPAGRRRGGEPRRDGPARPGAGPARRRRERAPWNNGWPGAEAPIRELNAQIATLGVPVLPFHETLEDPSGRAGCARSGRRRRPSVRRGLPAPRRASVPPPVTNELRRPLDDRTAPARARAPAAARRRRPLARVRLARRARSRRRGRRARGAARDPRRQRAPR